MPIRGRLPGQPKNTLCRSVQPAVDDEGHEPDLFNDEEAAKSVKGLGNIARDAKSQILKNASAYNMLILTLVLQ